MPDLQKLVIPAISNWLLNSLPPSSTRFLSFWMLPRLPSPGRKWEQENKISWVWSWQYQFLQTCSHFSHLPMIPGGNNPLQFITRVQVPQSPENTPSLVFLVWQSWYNFFFNLLLWLVWANVKASQYLHLFLILGKLKWQSIAAAAFIFQPFVGSMLYTDLTCYKNQMVIFYWVNGLLQRRGQFT